jgi:hypothetical protein
MKQMRYQSRFGNQQYDKYSVVKTRNKVWSPDASRQRIYNVNYQFDPQVANLYPAIQKYQMRAQSQIDNTTTVIANEILRRVWYGARQIHQNNPHLIDATDGVNHFTFKNEMIDDIFITQLLQQNSNFTK